ncbi:hypothetical protein C1646_773055 [Rhizophagus diaphanus]|nr:hypothetical protein C1646_773055 [Rhizophagus diaphanus] [Rhizophagus sp. MUCL 43196]
MSSKHKSSNELLKKGDKMSKLSNHKSENLELEMNMKGPEATNNIVESLELERLAEELGLDFEKNKDNLKKFYDFAGPNFSWPFKLNIYDRREIFDYIIDPRWEVGEEMANNTIAYYRFIEAGAFDSSKGTHVLIINGQIKDYYKDDISSEEYEELDKKYPGMYFAPITDEETVLLRRFSTHDDTTTKEWQVNFCIRSPTNVLDEARMGGVDSGYRMVIDTGATMTIIPYLLRSRLQNAHSGWQIKTVRASGYGDGLKLHKASRDWLVCVGDGNNWSNWLRT